MPLYSSIKMKGICLAWPVKHFVWIVAYYRIHLLINIIYVRTYRYTWVRYLKHVSHITLYQIQVFTFAANVMFVVIVKSLHRMKIGWMVKNVQTYRFQRAWNVCNLLSSTETLYFPYCTYFVFSFSYLPLEAVQHGDTNHYHK